LHKGKYLSLNLFNSSLCSPIDVAIMWRLVSLPTGSTQPLVYYPELGKHFVERGGLLRSLQAISLGWSSPSCKTAQKYSCLAKLKSQSTANRDHWPAAALTQSKLLDWVGLFYWQPGLFRRPDSRANQSA